MSFENFSSGLSSLHPSVVLVTGCSGFIGYHVCCALLEQGHCVIGIDDMNPYYDVQLKYNRLHHIQKGSHASRFVFYQEDITHGKAIENILSNHGDIQYVVHLAAQAGVRYSLENPLAYGMTNVIGSLILLEQCHKHLLELRHFVYASSSSVYGGNKTPFSVEQPTKTPLSIYAATKISQEMLAAAFSSLYGFPATGLRFFTVYGPWGRPDMAAFLFVKGLLDETPIQMFNKGKMRRNFTYIDDIVQGVMGCLQGSAKGHRVYNLGNDRSESLEDFLSVLQDLTGKKAIRCEAPLQAGDVPETIANIDESRKDFGFSPKTSIRQGLEKFVSWYREYYNV